MKHLTELLLEAAHRREWSGWGIDQLRTELYELSQIKERQETLMATLADLTAAVNVYQSAVTAKLASDQSVIAADTQEIADLHNSPIPDDLVQTLIDATAALTPNSAPADTTGGTPDGSDGSSGSPASV